MKKDVTNFDILGKTKGVSIEIPSNIRNLYALYITQKTYVDHNGKTHGWTVSKQIEFLPTCEGLWVGLLLGWEVFLWVSIFVEAK